MDLAHMIVRASVELQEEQQRASTCSVRVTLMRRFCCTLTTRRVGASTLRISWRGVHFHVPCGAEGPLRAVAAHIAGTWLQELPGRVIAWQADNASYLGAPPDPLHLDNWELAAAAAVCAHPTTSLAHALAAAQVHAQHVQAAPADGGGGEGPSAYTTSQGYAIHPGHGALGSSSSSGNTAAGYGNTVLLPQDPCDAESEPAVGDGGVSALLAGSTHKANRVVVACGSRVFVRTRFMRPEGVADALVAALMPLGFVEGVDAV